MSKGVEKISVKRTPPSSKIYFVEKAVQSLDTCLMAGISDAVSPITRNSFPSIFAIPEMVLGLLVQWTVFDSLSLFDGDHTLKYGSTVIRG